MVNAEVRDTFRATVLTFYQAHGRTLPWRQTRDPYKILVSEVMLQQTQVDRVVPKYEAFLAAYPTVSDLAAAPFASLYQHWQGLGYNRRALQLQRAAQQVRDLFDGTIPSDYATLLTLPGIGPYTAAAVCIFAFNQPLVTIETNIRRVYLHHFFEAERSAGTLVHDRQLLPLIEATLDSARLRDWYYALMDYGAYLGRSVPNPNRHSQQYVRQTPFAGSRRQVRGGILRELAAQPSQSAAQIAEKLQLDQHLVEPILSTLVQEGFLRKDSDGFRLRS